MTQVLDATGAAILDVAGRILAAEGAHSLTVRRIASEAGGSTMNVYSRFGSKDGVVEALFREGFRRLADAVGAVDTSGDPMVDLATCAGAYRQFALDNPTYYAVMFERVVADFEPSPEAMIEALATLELLADRVQRAMDAGRIDPGVALEVAAGLWAANHGLVSLELKEMGPGEDAWGTRHRHTMGALLRGLERGD